MIEITIGGMISVCLGFFVIGVGVTNIVSNLAQLFSGRTKK